jgi:hypothetical protein
MAVEFFFVQDEIRSCEPVHSLLEQITNLHDGVIYTYIYQNALQVSFLTHILCPSHLQRTVEELQ